jgi:hypothetical protein
LPYERLQRENDKEVVLFLHVYLGVSDLELGEVRLLGKTNIRSIWTTG